MGLHIQKKVNGQHAGGGPLITLRKVGRSMLPRLASTALRDIDLEIGAGEFISLVGNPTAGIPPCLADQCAELGAGGPRRLAGQ